MFNVVMSVMCVFVLEFYVGSRVSESYVEVPCVITEVGVLGEVVNDAFPMLEVDCKESFKTKFSFKLTDSDMNYSIRRMGGNDKCF